MHLMSRPRPKFRPEQRGLDYVRYDRNDRDHPAARILIVDDDREFCSRLADYLAEHNMQVLPASGRAEMARHFTACEPDLVLLDPEPGNDDGLDLLREVRSHSDVPIIIISGHCRGEADRVVGLELGADAYFTKPIALRELLARMRSVFRRHLRGRAALEREPISSCFKFDGWQLDHRKRLLLNPEGVQVPLTK